MALSMKKTLTAVAYSLAVSAGPGAANAQDGQGRAAAGVWCSAFDATERSCVAVRTVDQLSDTEALLRQVGVHDLGPGERLKLVIEVRAVRDGGQLCYDASGVTKIALFWTDNTAPMVTADDRPLPPERADRWRKRLARQDQVAAQPRVCWPKLESPDTFFELRDAETLVLRTP